ncbi:HET-domain-containing protein, partial [Thozetella sp. PMI_491]
MKKKVPAALRIVIHGPSDPLAGVLEVTLHGTSRALGREIRVLSRFNLRIVSPIVSVNADQDLRYGRILDNAKINLDLCRQWLQHCCRSHGQRCNTPAWSLALGKPEKLKFRLIDVWERRLVEFDSAQCEYVALSYVWGPIHLRKDLLELRQGVVKSFLQPNYLDRRVGKTIWDAMEIVRGINVRYLWTDRLCIIQDSNEDKAAQIGQMDRIYGNALLTIAAATSEHLDAGIPGITTNRSVTQIGEQVMLNPPVNILYPIYSDEDLQPWDTRAWTLQEKLLSKRILLFHHELVDFHCPCSVMHEDM